MRNRSGHKRIERHFQKSQSGIHKEPKTSFPQPKRGKEKIIPCEIEGTPFPLERRRLTGCAHTYMELQVHGDTFPAERCGRARKSPVFDSFSYFAVEPGRFLLKTHLGVIEQAFLYPPVVHS